MGALVDPDWVAREIHDAVGHHVSLIAVQAGIGLHLLDRDPDRGRGALEAITQLSRELLTELRALLGALHGLPAPPEATRDGLARIRRLAAESTSAGLPVRLDVGATVEVLPAEVGAAAHRIVQEALTNVRRHARASQVWLSVSRDDSGLRVRVDDDGRGGSPGGCDGHGLRGMRARATALRGSFAAGPRPGGGFRVSAWLPITELCPSPQAVADEREADGCEPAAAVR